MKFCADWNEPAKYVKKTLLPGLRWQFCFRELGDPEAIHSRETIRTDRSFTNVCEA